MVKKLPRIEKKVEKKNKNNLGPKMKQENGW